jgi:uncharacterized membrane protein
MLACALGFSLMGVCVKQVGGRIPAAEVVLARAIVSVVLSWWLLQRAGVDPWGQRRGLLILRGAIGTVALLCVYAALALLPLASATVLQYLYPTITALLAWLMLGEPIGRRVLLAMLLGWIGVLLVAQPGGLLQGASAAGWDAYESRPLPDPGTGARPWLGGPLDGGSILVVAEQGIGDLFQFLRFVPLLGDRGADQVLVEAPAGTAALLTASGFRAVPRGSRPATDWFVPLLSLPHRLGMDRDLLGHRVPYLAPPRDAAPPHSASVPYYCCCSIGISLFVSCGHVTRCGCNRSV